MTSLTYIIAKYEAAFESFETTNKRPTDLYVTQIYDAIAKIFYPICYYSVGVTYNLIGLIDEEAAYATEYSKSIARPLRLGIYASDIDTTKDAYLDSQKKEAIQKARIDHWQIYLVAKSKANRFIVHVVADVWISPLSKGSPTFYAKRKTKEMLHQIQVVCTEHHTIYLPALQDKMRTMHVTIGKISQYIVALEKAQLQAARAEMPIPDNYLMMVAMKAVLSSERFPQVNKDWEDLENVSKSWMKWCELYKKADMKETIRIKARERKRNNSAERRLAVQSGGRNFQLDNPPQPPWNT